MAMMTKMETLKLKALRRNKRSNYHYPEMALYCDDDEDGGDADAGDVDDVYDVDRVDGLGALLFWAQSSSSSTRHLCR